MATLRRLSDGSLFPLPAQCIIGRSSTCALRVDESYVSQEHAKILWTGNDWSIRDLGSRNGTFVDKKRLEPGSLHPLHEGSGIGFGDEEPRWILSDATRPGVLAVDVATGTIRAAVGDLLLLPDETTPELSIHHAKDGLGWVIEDSEGVITPLNDGDLVDVLGRSFRIELPVGIEETPMYREPKTLDRVWFRFEVTRDEEHVAITIIHRGLETPLESREHGYLLLTLARCRRQDADLPEADRGWRTIDQLSRMLRMKINTLHVSTHRARLQLAAAGVEGATGIIESRSGSRRFGSERFEIIEGLEPPPDREA